MIVLPADGLTPDERFGLEVLVDLARLLPASPGLGALVAELVDAGPGGVAGLASDPEVVEGRLRLPRAALATVGALVSATAEQGTPARDRLGRVPSAANALVAAGAEHDPVVSRYAARVRAVAARGAGDRPFRTLAPWPEGKRWAIALTHDLDVVALWPVFSGLRVVELARKGQGIRVARTLVAALGAVGGDPVGHAVANILLTEAEAGLRSTWFILCGTPTWATFRKGDLTYRPESRRARAILEAIDAGGHEIGLHGSLETAVHPDRFATQRDRLVRLVPRAHGGVRQHFLRMDPGPSQAGMVAAGLAYDATWGFSDRNGFRLGVADVVPWRPTGPAPEVSFDLAPFCWMDRTQSKYQGIEDPAEWVRAALAQAERCRAVEGMWSGIWHPNLTAPLGYPGAREAFRDLARGLAADPVAWTASLGEIVRWRRRRRSATAVGVDAAGEVRIRMTEAGRPLVLEDAAGAVRETASA